MTPGNDWLWTAWTQTWQVSLLIVAVALLARLAAANRPQLAFALWLVVFVKCVTPPLWSSPGGAFCRLQPPRVCADARRGEAGRLGETLTVSERRSSSSPGQQLGKIERIKPVVLAQRVNRSANSWPTRPIDEQDTIRSPGSFPGLAEQPDLRPTEPPGLRPTEPLPPSLATPAIAMTGLATLLGSIWLAGAIAVFSLIAWRRVRFLQLLRRAGRVENPAYETILASLRRRLRLRGRVRLIVTEQLVGPAVLGLIRPTVLLPRAVVEGKSAEELELILAHELMHIRRGDLWFGLLRSVVELLWWFHPLVWWASRRASREAERCCDEAVLAELQCGPASYARCLLDVLEAKHQLRSVPACPGVRAIEITQERLERIMRIGQRGYRQTPWWCWVVAIAAAAAVLPGAAIGTSGDKIDSVPPANQDGKTKTSDTPVAPKAVRGKGSSTLVPKRDIPSADSAREQNVRLPKNVPTLAPPLREYAGFTRDSGRIDSPSSVTDIFGSDEPKRTRPSNAPSRRYVDAQRYPRVPQPPAPPRLLVDGVGTYMVDDIVALISSDQGLDMQKSREFLKKALKSQFTQSKTTMLARSENTTYDAALGAGVFGPPTPSSAMPIDIVWNGNVLLIETTAEGHKRIAESLAIFREHGMGQIKIDVRFATGSAVELDKVKLNWTFLASEFPASAASNDDGGPSLSTPFAPALDGRKGSRPIRSQFVIEKISPMMYNILDEDAGAKVIDQWQANNLTNILQAPKLTVFNGRSAFVSDCTQSPFVVAVKDGKPWIRVVNEGTILQIRPLVEEPDKLALDFRAEFSKIGKVETADLPAAAEGKPVTIQIPEVATSRVEGAVELPWNKWLLLGGLERKNEGKGSPDHLIVMLRAEKVAPFRIPPKREREEAFYERAPGPVPVR